ncbi:MAG: FGGY family carbohydrate kinase [Balneolaceae bacterium]
MSNNGYLLGYDVGSSFVKGCLIDSETGRLVASASAPGQEMEMVSDQPGWAEQSPTMWWKQIVSVTRQLLAESGVQGKGIVAIGISYQMHGLVVVDKNRKVLRPSIIWCDGRAVQYGQKAFQELGQEECLGRFLNSPGNFTASKLKWVKENEPEIYEKVDKVMLPGDYIGMKLTGEIRTTVSGLSEGIFWDYKEEGTATSLLDYYGISADLLPEALPSFGDHGQLTSEAADELGLSQGTKVTYRAGDQPNNAFSLNVLEPGEVAATAGTSGVVYGITDQPDYDAASRVNSFVHVNHKKDRPRYGVLLCVNGSGILNSWLKRNLGIDNALDYDQMNVLASEAPIGSDGLVILPFGNGAERILENRDIGAQIHGLQFNRHSTAHMLRAAQEGVVFALNYGFLVMKDMGMKLDTVKAGHANMFLSPVFRDTFVHTTGTTLELYNTDGAQGAARGAGVGAGIYSNPSEAFSGLKRIDVIEPDENRVSRYEEAYQQWADKLPF